MTIRVLIADDQTLVRQGIRSLLELVAGLCVVGEASDGEEAIALAESTPAEVLLLDVRMPKKTGLQVLAELCSLPNAPPTILLTTFDDDAVAVEGIRLGARGFLLKDVTLEQLRDAIFTVAGGGTLFNPVITERVIRGLSRISQSFEASSYPDVLTPREREVLRLIAAGDSNREIGQLLGMAEGTVKNHASSILSKLGVRDRTRAVLRAIELGYL